MRRQVLFNVQGQDVMQSEHCALTPLLHVPLSLLTLPFPLAPQRQISRSKHCE